MQAKIITILGFVGALALLGLFSVVYNRGHQHGYLAGLVNQKNEAPAQEIASDSNAANDMISTLTSHITTCDAEVAKLKEALSYYENVYGANDNGHKLREFRVNELSDGTIELFGLVSKSGSDVFEGTLSIQFVSNEQVISQKQLPLKFKHFQEIRHNFAAFEAEKPSTLALEVLSNNQSILKQEITLALTQQDRQVTNS